MKCKLTDDDLLNLGYTKNILNQYLFKTYNNQYTCFIDLKSREITLIRNRDYLDDLDLSLLEKDHII